MIDFLTCNPKLILEETTTAKVRRWVRILVFLAGATLLFFWPVWIAGYRFPIGGGDLWGQLHPVWSYVAEWLRRGVVPLWHTGMSAGDPIVAEGQYGIFNPLNWPLFLLSPVPAWAVALRGMATLWLAGVGMYCYLRYSPVWKLRETAALIGALAYMFADPFVAHLGHPQFNDALAWLPWTLWAVDGAMRRRRAIPLAALTLACLALSGHGQATLYGALTIGGYALWQACAGGMQRVPRRVGRLALVGLLAVALVMPTMLPGFERLPYTERANVPANLGEYEFHLGMWRDFITPLFHGRNRVTFWGPWNRVETGSVGAVALGLALLGLIARPRGRTAFLWIVGALAVLLALGTQGPLYPLLSSLPLFDATWKTGRAIYVLSFVLALAAAEGTERLLRQSYPVWSAGMVVAAAWIAVRAPAWASLAPNVAAVSRALLGLYLAAAALAFAALLGLGLRRRFCRAGLIVLVLTELVVTGAFADVEPASNAENDPHRAAIAYLQADEGWFRVDVDGAARGLWSPAAVMAAGFAVPQGTGNPMEIVTYNQFYWGIPHKGMPAYHLLGAKYIVVPKGALPGGDGIWPVFFDDALVDIHLNTNALQRVWLVYHTLPVDTLEAAYARVFAADFAPAVTATVLDGPALETPGTGRIEVLAYSPNRAAFYVETSAPALLVLSDLLYPGWRATVDGAATRRFTPPMGCSAASSSRLGRIAWQCGFPLNPCAGAWG
ncbi:MAG TPA: YfhO family protein [Anaerolineae bacterium]|mgnify:CR=1 FL=1|nr:YfhO family protein [Anaerolineae bacterium]HQI85111.1 YfhO family protein [Anaerolineae bacterium]